jgi:hypothetical protein
MRATLSIIIFQLLFISCQKTAVPTPEEVLEKAVQAHGGALAFEAVKVFSFQKKTSSYDSLVVLTKLVEQSFAYDFKKGTSALGWRENNQKHQLTRDSLGLSLRVNDTLKTLSEPEKKGFESLLNGGLFVYWQPFKLSSELPKNATVSPDTLMNIPVWAVSFQFDHSSDHWVWYFDQSSGVFLGNRVWHNNRYSLILNQSWLAYQGLKLPKERVSYRVNKDNKILYKQADYVYGLDN